MKRSWILSFAALALVLAFQNCERPSNFSSNESAPQNLDAGNGHPYDGIYVQLGPICTDGTFVVSRIRMTSDTTAQLLRQNCQTIAPIALGAQDFTYNGANDTLVYGGISFTPERPSVKVPLLASWYYQLTGTLSVPSAAQVADVDMFETSAATISSLKAANHTVLCYISVGMDETFRPDASSFQAADIGTSAGAQQKWIDTRSANVRAIMLARLDLAKSKGCSGVDLDSIDSYTSTTGFPLTFATQLDYAQFLAFAAHDRKLIVGLKNSTDLAASVVQVFDLAISERCYQDGDCAKYQPFVTSGKAVLAVSETAKSAPLCTQSASESISLIFASSALDGSGFATCP